MRASEHADAAGMKTTAPLPPAVNADDDDWETQDLTVAVTATATAGTSVDAATDAFGTMRLLQAPPMPAQDGGAYERVPHESFDQSSAYAQPVTPATASAASVLNGGGAPMDPVLVACLDNPRERLTLLKFEDQIVRFIKSSREPQLTFPPLSSYHRLIVHRLAERCCLEHQTADYNPYAQQYGGYDGNSSRVVTLFKTPQSIIPSVLLIDLSADRQQQTVTPASAPKIMMRKRGGPRPGANGGRGNSDAKNAQRTMQDREKAYAEARARIFGEESASTTEAPSSSSSSTSTLSASRAAGAATSEATAGSSGSNPGPKFGSQQAFGPDGSRGFAGGRGRGRAIDRSPQLDRSEFDRNVAVVASNDQPPSRAQNTQNWKESKVLWRNREQELNDPDFTRNHDAYRPSRNAANNGGGRYAPPPPPQQQMNRYPLPSQQHMDYYDGPASASQQQRPPYSGGYQQPPVPGRRFPTGDFNRLDNTGMQQRSPPPPPDHFRGGHHHMSQPPPPPPQGRGGYGYTSPHNRQPNYNSSVRHAADSRNGGGYNDDFPPLGK